MKVLITAGPTQEPIDDVRFITNASSGKMGAAVALEAMARGHEVTLVHGPVSITLPECKKIAVRTTKEMVDAVMSELASKGGKGGYDIVISTAAISDFSPSKASGKITSGKSMTLELMPTPKLIEEIRSKYPQIFLVAFKAEFGRNREELKAVAKEFLRRKGLDMVVANDLEKNYFGVDTTDIFIVSKETAKEFKETSQEFGKKSKTELAKSIWNEIELRTARGCPV